MAIESSLICPLNMVIFHRYVSLPEGCIIIQIFSKWHIAMQFLIAKSTIIEPFSMAMLVYQRVNPPFFAVGTSLGDFAPAFTEQVATLAGV